MTNVDMEILNRPQPPWVVYTHESVRAISALRGFALATGIRVYELDGTRMQTKAGVLRELANVLKLPSYFGSNWDALSECLADLSWDPARGYLMIISDASSVLADEPGEMANFLAVIDEIANERSHPTEPGNPLARLATPFHMVLLEPSGNLLEVIPEFQIA